MKIFFHVHIFKNIQQRFNEYAYDCFAFVMEHIHSVLVQIAFNPV